MSALILRTVYALNSNTGLFLSTGQVLLTDGLGGTYWTSMLSSLIIAGGSVMNDLPSTIQNNSTQIYYNTSYFEGLSSLSRDMYSAISSLSTSISETVLSNIGNLNGVSQDQMASSIAGLGGLGWASTSEVYAIMSTASGIGEVSQNSISSIASGLSTFGIYPLSTLNTFNASSFSGLGQLGYISSQSFFSSLDGMGNLGYISSTSLTSTIDGLGSLGYISTSAVMQETLESTINSLGSVGYISTPSLVSTILGLGSYYISAATLCNYVTQGFSTLINMSTVTGLGSSGYISTSALVSTTLGIQLRNPDIRFDTTTSVTTIGSYNTFINAGTIIYISTFLKSSISYAGSPSGVQTKGVGIPPYDMKFSTASIDFTPFRPYINRDSRITLDIFPTIAFSKLATGATNVAVLPISSFLQQGYNDIKQTMVTSFVYVGNTRVSLENGRSVDASNLYNTPISIQIPPGTVSNYTQPYSLVHYMPNSINNAQYQNALHSTMLTPYFSPTGSIFVSVQNMA